MGFKPFLLAAAIFAPLTTAMPALAADAAIGRELATAKCTLCHGPNGNAVNPVVPKLAGQNELYILKALADFASDKRKDAEMNIIAKKLSQEDIENLAAWFSSVHIEVSAGQ